MAAQESPYLAANDRLADVIAAIQVMGTYKFYKLDFAGWSARISGDSSQAEHWRIVFLQHPEFFRLNTQRNKSSLVWRRQHQKLYDVDKEARITKEEYADLNDTERRRISRMPLQSNEIATLISTATNLHSRALERKRDSRWWTSGVFSLVGVILGAAMTALTK